MNASEIERVTKAAALQILEKAGYRDKAPATPAGQPELKLTPELKKLVKQLAALTEDELDQVLNGLSEALGEAAKG